MPKRRSTFNLHLYINCKSDMARTQWTSTPTTFAHCGFVLSTFIRLHRVQVKGDHNSNNPTPQKTMLVGNMNANSFLPACLLGMECVHGMAGIPNIYPWNQMGWICKYFEIALRIQGLVTRLTTGYSVMFPAAKSSGWPDSSIQDIHGPIGSGSESYLCSCVGKLQLTDD